MNGGRNWDGFDPDELILTVPIDNPSWCRLNGVVSTWNVGGIEGGRYAYDHETQTLMRMSAEPVPLMVGKFDTLQRAEFAAIGDHYSRVLN